MKTIDARGLSCPEPVVLARNALRNESELEVLVDSPAPRENVSRFARSQGCAVEVADVEDGWRISIKR